MSILWHVLRLVDFALIFIASAGAAYAIVNHIPAGRGKHISKIYRRMIPWMHPFTARSLMLLAVIIDESVTRRRDGSVLIVMAIFWLWIIDDCFFSEDDDRRKRLLASVKAKLRKCKPVMQRLAQQWKPRVPRIPVPVRSAG